MTSKTVVMDIETDGFDATKIWVVCAKDLDTGEDYKFYNLTTIPEEETKFKDFCAGVNKFIMHNGIQFDAPTINRLLGATIVPLEHVIDTLVLSRMINYNIDGGHSLKAHGIRLGCYKGEHNDFSNLTFQMVEYCEQDVIVTYKLYKDLMSKIGDYDEWRESINTEHRIQVLCQQMHENGFMFNAHNARTYLDEIRDRMAELERGFQTDFPPQLIEVNRIKYRKKADGSLYSNVEKAMDTYPKYSIIDETVILYDYKTFNPGSSKDRIEVLWRAGWNPVDRTKTHIMKDRDGMLDEKTRVYGWMCNETNLNTLPKDAPDSARNLAEWLTLEGRRSSLVEWLGCVAEDGRVHGRFQHIGAWTGRMAHSKPNQANIPASFHGVADTPVKQVKDKYDGKFRELWCVPEDSWLVGTDAEGIQLRILAHLMKSEEYTEAIINGKKEDETDIHNLNRKALGMSHVTRDMAKTFIYAFLLGAGVGKISQILKVKQKEATEAVENFMQSIDGLAKLKKQVIPHIARRGWFRGLDGRKVIVPSEHKTLAGLLQNGEAVIMKHAALEWTLKAQMLRLDYKLVTWPHDEWQTELKGTYENAELLGDIQRQSIKNTGDKLNIFCPLAGSTEIGKNWLQTH